MVHYAKMDTTFSLTRAHLGLTVFPKACGVPAACLWLITRDVGAAARNGQSCGRFDDDDPRKCGHLRPEEDSDENARHDGCGEGQRD